MSAPVACPICAKTFKNVRLHVAKVHEAVKVVMSADEYSVPDVFYCGIELLGGDAYDADGITTITYEFTKQLRDTCKYDGVAIDIDSDNKVIGCIYYKYPKDESCGFKEVGKVALHRVTVETKKPEPPKVVAAPAPAPVVAPQTFKEWLLKDHGIADIKTLPSDLLCNYHNLWDVARGKARIIHTDKRGIVITMPI